MTTYHNNLCELDYLFYQVYVKTVVSSDYIYAPNAHTDSHASLFFVYMRCCDVNINTPPCWS